MNETNQLFQKIDSCLLHINNPNDDSKDFLNESCTAPRKKYTNATSEKKGVLRNKDSKKNLNKSLTSELEKQTGLNPDFVVLASNLQ